MLFIVLFIVVIFILYFIEKTIEKKHFESIGRRQVKLILLPVVATKGAVRENRPIKEARLVYANAVISFDYFKRLSAAKRNFFGGEISAYEVTLTRTREEAILRLKEKVPTADIIINLRLETATIGRKNNGSIACAEVLAYGTAITYEGYTYKGIKRHLRLKNN